MVVCLFVLPVGVVITASTPASATTGQTNQEPFPVNPADYGGGSGIYGGDSGPTGICNQTVYADSSFNLDGFQVGTACQTAVPCPNPSGDACWGVSQMYDFFPSSGIHTQCCGSSYGGDRYNFGGYDNANCDELGDNGAPQWEALSYSDWTSGSYAECVSQATVAAGAGSWAFTFNVTAHSWGPVQVDSRGHYWRALSYRTVESFPTSVSAHGSGWPANTTQIAPCLTSSCVSTAQTNSAGLGYIPSFTYTCWSTCGIPTGDPISVGGVGNFAQLAIGTTTILPQGSGVEPAMPDLYFVGGSAEGITPSSEPCTLVSVTGNQPGGETTGTQYSFTFDFVAGTVQAIIVDPQDGGTTAVPGGGQYGTSVDSSFQTVSTGKSQETVAWHVEVAGAWDPQFWCIYNGTAYYWGKDSTTGTLTPPVGPNGGGSFDFATCVDEAGSNLDLFNPVTWIVAGAKVGLCALEWLFIPSTSTVDELQQEFGIGVNPSDALPVSEWVGAVGAIAAQFPTTQVAKIQTAVDGGNCSDSSFALGGQSFSLCTALLASANSSAVTSHWGAVDAVVTAFFVVMIALAVFMTFRRLMERT